MEAFVDGLSASTGVFSQFIRKVFSDIGTGTGSDDSITAHIEKKFGVCEDKDVK